MEGRLFSTDLRPYRHYCYKSIIVQAFVNTCWVKWKEWKMQGRAMPGGQGYVIFLTGDSGTCLEKDITQLLVGKFLLFF